MDYHQTPENYAGAKARLFESLEEGTVAVFDPTNRTGQVTRVRSPESNHTDYTYDARSNLTGTLMVPKPSSPLASFSTSSNFDTTCANPMTCNKPNWVRDARGNQTDFTYSATHGGVLTVTLPAAVNGIRPQTRYAYAQRYAWVKNAAGSFVQSASPIWVRTQESFCRTSASTGSGCSLAGDEVVTTYEFGANGGANNLFPRGMAITADGQTLRTC